MRMRNKILVLIGVVAIALSLASCSSSTAQAKTTQKEKFEFVYTEGNFKVFQDTDTDVLYLLVYYRTGYTMTPLLNPDGTPRTSMSLPK